ncbi:MAG: MFS transporter [Alphaproteobacteria bacterium]|nr:MFS transporter [Alphaproteobacteria bacterium]
MTLRSSTNVTHHRHLELGGRVATCTVATLVGALFAGSTVLTPLYAIYKQSFGFSQITLTLIYAVYVLGNLAALSLFGRVSDQIGRVSISLAAIGVAIASTLVFLFATGTTALFIGRILSGVAIGVGAGTGTAWLAELIDEKDKSRASTIATASNFIGLGIGSLIAGALAQYAPWPLQLSFIVYLVVLLAVVPIVWLTRETVAEPCRSLDCITLRPRFSVPAAIRAQFVAPAVTAFGSLALVGFYAVIAPSVLAEQLHMTSHLLAGAMFFELAAICAGTIWTIRHVDSRIAMLSSLALMVPSVALVVTAQVMASMTVMIIATAICAIAAGCGYRGSLQVVNQIAPEQQRAEIVSSYYLCGFAGNALPVIGIGVIATFASMIAASITFAVMIVVFALVALYFGLRTAKPKSE